MIFDPSCKTDHNPDHSEERVFDYDTWKKSLDMEKRLMIFRLLLGHTTKYLFLHW
jgi:hypothetical protein